MSTHYAIKSKLIAVEINSDQYSMKLITVKLGMKTDKRHEAAFFFIINRSLVMISPLWRVYGML
jgi:hypothetical protein